MGQEQIGISPEQASFQGAFQNFLQNQQGIDPNSIFGRITTQNLQSPLFGGFNLAGLTGQQGPDANFNTFLSGGGGIRGFADQAVNSLQSIAQNSTGVPSANIGVLQGAAPGNEQGGFQSNAALLGLRNILPQSIAARFGGQLVGQAENDFNRAIAGQATGGVDPGSFAGFLLQALGLGGA